MRTYIFDGGNGVFTIEGTPYTSAQYQIFANENTVSIWPIIETGNYITNNVPFANYLKPGGAPYTSSAEIIADFAAFAVMAGGADNFNGGFVDYNDLATQTTPITVTGGGGFVTLTNDGEGANTNETYLPSGITSVYDKVESFDFTQLKLGDMLDIRLDIQVIIASVNTEVEVDLFLGTGGGAYQIPFEPKLNFKSTGTFNINRFNGIYMGDTNTLDNSGKFKMSSDKTCTVKVNGWYVKIIRKG